MTSVPTVNDDRGLWDVVAVAAALGISPASVRTYRCKGLLPPPDEILGRSPGWRPATIEAWAATRSGRTGRPRKG